MILSVVHRESSRLNEMHNLSRNDADLQVLRYAFPCLQGSKLIVLIKSCFMPRYMVLGSMVPELHAMRKVCLMEEFV